MLLGGQIVPVCSESAVAEACMMEMGLYFNRYFVDVTQQETPTVGPETVYKGHTIPSARVGGKWYSGLEAIVGALNGLYSEGVSEDLRRSDSVFPLLDNRTSSGIQFEHADAVRTLWEYIRSAPGSLQESNLLQQIRGIFDPLESAMSRKQPSTSVSVLELSLSAFVETYAMLVQVVKGVKLFEYTLDGPSTFVTPMYPHLSNLAGQFLAQLFQCSQQRRKEMAHDLLMGRIRWVERSSWEVSH